MPKWDDEKVAILREGVAAGTTFGEMERLRVFDGFTRNALIGKAHRLGLSSNSMSVAATNAAAHRKARLAEENKKRDELHAAKQAVGQEAAPPAPQRVPPSEFSSNYRAATPEEIARSAQKAAAELAAIEPVPDDGAVGFYETRDRHCRMPLWRTGTRPSLEEMRFCGKQTLPGKSWCAGCRQRVFLPKARPSAPSRSRMEAW